MEGHRNVIKGRWKVLKCCQWKWLGFLAIKHQDINKEFWLCVQSMDKINGMISMRNAHFCLNECVRKYSIWLPDNMKNNDKADAVTKTSGHYKLPNGNLVLFTKERSTPWHHWDTWGQEANWGVSDSHWPWYGNVGRPLQTISGDGSQKNQSHAELEKGGQTRLH